MLHRLAVVLATTAPCLFSAAARPAPPVEATFSDFSFGAGSPFAGGTVVAGVGVALTTHGTEPFGSGFRDTIANVPAPVDFVFTQPVQEFHLDVSYVKADEFLTNFSLGIPTSLSGDLVVNGGRVTTSRTDDNGRGRVSWTGISVLSASFTITADPRAPAPALAVDAFGILPSATSASIARAATGCGGLTIDATGCPALGDSVHLALGGSGGANAVFGYGFAPARIDLCPPAPCAFGTFVEGSIPGPTLTLTIPSDPAVLGSRVFLQGISSAPGGCLIQGVVPIVVGDTIELVVG